jgi:polar amino acid transport system substrate-binding protein
MINFFFRHLFFIFVFLALSSCVGNSYDSRNSYPEKNKEILRVGITPNAPPMAYMAKGSITGLEAELARGLAKFTGRKLHFVQLRWEEQIPALLAGKIDIIMSSMTITPARSYRIAFCTPYMISGQVMLVRAKEIPRFSNGLTDLFNTSITIGTVKDTTGDFFIEQYVPRGKTIRFRRPDQGVRALIKGEINVFVYDLPMNFYFAAYNDVNGLAPITTPITREQIALGVRPDDTRLLQQANAYLAILKQNGRLKKMLIRWIPFFKNVFNS